MRRINRSTVLVTCLCAASLPWSAAGSDPDQGHRESDWSTHAGVGFSLSPGGFLFNTGAEYNVVPALGIGPLFQFVVAEDTLIVAPTANARYRFDLSHLDDKFLRNVEPFVQGGLGFAYVERERPGRDLDGTEFLLNGGLGFDYAFTDHFSIGNSILFNGMPADDAAGEEFFVSWQFLTARLNF